jgi:hypothetical protein
VSDVGRLGRGPTGAGIEPAPELNGKTSGTMLGGYREGGLLVPTFGVGPVWAWPPVIVPAAVVVVSAEAEPRSL